MEHSICIVIPAYEPDEKLIDVVKSLKTLISNVAIVVVDDGSKKECNAIFKVLEKDIILLRHETNKGKGVALKTAFKYIKSSLPEIDCIITADADGQHKPEDILRISYELYQHMDGLVIGSRKMEENVPLRSLVGNGITRFLFRVTNRQKLWETQSGLRAFSKDLLSTMIQIPGKRYEYEMNVLMDLAKEKKEIHEMEIATVYLDDNSSSHFRPFKDSFLLYYEILKYSMPSFMMALLQLTLFIVLNLTIVSSRLEMIHINICAMSIGMLGGFFINRFHLLRGKICRTKSVFKYIFWSIVTIALYTGFLFGLNYGIENRIVCKLICDLIMFIMIVIIRYLTAHKKQ